jgi:hypothetical protein
VLELPDDVDADTRSRAHPVERAQVESWLASGDERTVLRGVLAARQSADVALLERVHALRRHPSAVVAQAAARVSDELRAAVQDGASGSEPARRQALAAIEVLRAQVTPLLRAISHERSGEVLNAVGPRDQDYAKAFVPEAVEAARKAYADIWGHAFDMRYPDAGQTVITSEIAPAGMLASDNELSRRFPGGYRRIAHLLQPHRVWVSWKYLRPGADAGMAYDGLVWLDDHWAWFPKPYRAL